MGDFMQEAERLAKAMKCNAAGSPSSGGASSVSQHHHGATQAPPAASALANQSAGQQGAPPTGAPAVFALTEKQEDEITDFISKLSAEKCEEHYKALGGTGQLTGNVTKKRIRLTLFGANVGTSAFLRIVMPLMAAGTSALEFAEPQFQKSFTPAWGEYHPSFTKTVAFCKSKPQGYPIFVGNGCKVYSAKATWAAMKSAPARRVSPCRRRVLHRKRYAKVLTVLCLLLHF